MCNWEDVDCVCPCCLLWFCPQVIKTKQEWITTAPQGAKMGFQMYFLCLCSVIHPLKSMNPPTHLCAPRQCVTVLSAPRTALFIVCKVGRETCALQATFKKNPGNIIELVVQMLLMWVLSTEESGSFGFITLNIAEASNLPRQTKLRAS